jgi:desulfoferrodoxin-like iron-binding protein
MKKESLNRRSFVQSAALVAGSFAASSFFPDSRASASLQKAPGIFICSVCGHIEFGGVQDFCPVCHAPKEKFQQKDTVFSEAAASNKEGSGKHTPSILVKDSALIPEEPCKEAVVRIGKVLHPMTEAHHIRFLDCYVDDKFVARADLTANLFPAAAFSLKAAGSKVRIVELCNLHGYWQAEANLK